MRKANRAGGNIFTLSSKCGGALFDLDAPMNRVHSPSRAFLVLLLCLLASPSGGLAGSKAEALVAGETFTIDSKVLGETRRINVYLPRPYRESSVAALPVLYLLDGGMAEDFLHIAGLVQVSVANQTMRPFLLIGIENTQRRRDLTGPTANADERKIAPHVGGSAAFREFIRKELAPEVTIRYRTTGETAIVGESLAALFVVETFFLAPDLFDIYLAIDPSLWWNGRELVTNAVKRLGDPTRPPTTLFLASSDEQSITQPVEELVEILRTNAPSSVRWHYEPMAGEHHGTIYHAAAMRAFRTQFQPAAK